MTAERSAKLIQPNARHHYEVTADDLPVKEDGVHFDNAGLELLGERMAAEWLRLNGGCG